MAGSNLGRDIVAWLGRAQQVSMLFVIVLFLISSLAVIYSAHMTRQMYGSLQILQSDQDDLDSEYEKLLLEQSAWADYTRVHQLAREELKMAAPSAKELMIVESGFAHPAVSQ